MSLPVIVAVDEHPDVLHRVRSQLAERYASRYRIECACGCEDGGRLLERLFAEGAPGGRARSGRPAEGTRAEPLIDQARKLHPLANRALLVSLNAWLDRQRAEAIRRGGGLGP